MLLIFYCTSSVDVCVRVSLLACACVHPSHLLPLLQSSTRRSAKVSLSTADRTAEIKGHVVFFLGRGIAC